jgi:high-affinity Fe2+/Pb2+ permease
MRWLARIRTGLARTASYLALFNFAILAGIMLRWLHGGLAPSAPFILWMVVGYLVLALVVAGVAWVDHRYVWPAELGVSQAINPLTTLTVFRLAVLLRDLEREGLDTNEVRRHIVMALSSNGHEKDLERWEKMLGGR